MREKMVRRPEATRGFARPKLMAKKQKLELDKEGG
jgi:hypothetical protein